MKSFLIRSCIDGILQDYTNNGTCSRFVKTNCRYLKSIVYFVTSAESPPIEYIHCLYIHDAHMTWLKILAHFERNKKTVVSHINLPQTLRSIVYELSLKQIIRNCDKYDEIYSFLVCASGTIEKTRNDMYMYNVYEKTRKALDMIIRLKNSMEKDIDDVDYAEVGNFGSCFDNFDVRKFFEFIDIIKQFILYEQYISVQYTNTLLSVLQKNRVDLRALTYIKLNDKDDHDENITTQKKDEHQNVHINAVVR